ncbi:MAG: hypothetical protein WC799_13305 [Desulfobacteraceae bacterium]|jgi:glycosyltransferase involved in cell wall biosynthesis
MKNGIWITWEKQIRNKGISESLNWKLYELIINKPRLVRYFVCTLRTILIIYLNRKNIIAVQNPSILLSLIAVLLKKIFKFPLIIDSHNAGILPFEGRNNCLMKISAFIQKNSNLTIVTNIALKQIVEENNGRAFILQDKIYSPFESFKPLGYNLKGRFNIACICTFSNDEPFGEMIKSGHIISDDIFLYFTGNYKGKFNTNELSSNVKLLGYISDDSYWSLLNSVDAVLDLTLRENCLVCGAYEGISVGKPLILSDTVALRSYFNKGCIFVTPDAKSISDGINEIIKNYKKYQNDIIILRKTLSESWNKRLIELNEKIATW